MISGLGSLSNAARISGVFIAATRSSVDSGASFSFHVGLAMNTWKFDVSPWRMPVGRPAICGRMSMPWVFASSAMLYILLPS